jgi:hypothetical protein
VKKVCVFVNRPGRRTTSPASTVGLKNVDVLVDNAGSKLKLTSSTRGEKKVCVFVNRPG